MHFLDFHAKRGTAYLHPGGAGLTEALITECGLKNGTRVLEIGCGTGATIVKIAKRYKLQAVAADVSENMLKSARQRAVFNNVTSGIVFIKVHGGGILPFKDNSFDAIYAESVLAIADETVLPLLLREISRVLVNGGRFVSNDAIWKDSASVADIERINRACIEDFGIVQSIANPACLEQWKLAFEAAGLFVAKAINQNSIITRPRNEKSFFRYYKKLSSLFSVAFILSRRRYNQVLKERHANDGSFLDNYLFVMENRKDKVTGSENI